MLRQLFRRVQACFRPEMKTIKIIRTLDASGRVVEEIIESNGLDEAQARDFAARTAEVEELFKRLHDLF